MDNLCHSLVGAAFGEAGLKRQTRFGMPVLIVAANLPDVDVLAFAVDIPVVAIRRGWTHGVLAQLLLPALFAGLVLIIDRFARPPRAGPPARAVPLLALGYVGVLSHVALDWLNNYGVRLLMPFSARWFYGDSVFIIDPWLWISLALGVFLSRRRNSLRPASIALACAALYIAAMVWSARAARSVVLDAWIAAHGGPPRALMVGPAPVNPLRKSIIVDAGNHYERGSFSWWPRDVAFDRDVIPKRADDPAVARAKTDRDVAAVLVWARFPYYEVERGERGTIVTVRDVRFGARIGTATTIVRE